MSKISAPQLRRLQTVYEQWRKHEGMLGTRELRLAEASKRLGRVVYGFSDLSAAQAKQLIDAFQDELGIAETAPAKRLSQRDRQKLGTEGRRDQAHDETTMAGPRDVRRLQEDLERLGWDEKRLQGFLASASGPLCRRTTLNTLGDYNKVHWALKHIKPDAEQHRTAC